LRVKRDNGTQVYKQWRCGSFAKQLSNVFAKFSAAMTKFARCELHFALIYLGSGVPLRGRRNDDSGI
jgi:hypothetical protein